MPTASAGLYRIILEQTYLGSTMFNVYGYISSLGLDDVQDLCAKAFDEDVIASLADILSINVSFDSIRCVNITGTLADEVISPVDANGDVVGADLAPFMAAPFRYNRATKDTRNGSKRYAGLIEQNVTAETFVALYLVDLQTHAAVLGANIDTVGGIFVPIILGSETVTPGLWNYNTIVSVQALDRVSSQVSRKSF